jgi:hypothetical protein
MRKILLTSSGFENQRIMALFRQLLGKEPGSAKALFIPTAAIDADAIAVLPKCMNDLLSAGIPAANIAVFDLHRNMPYEELWPTMCLFHGAIRVSSRRVNDSGFAASLGQYLDVAASRRCERRERDRDPESAGNLAISTVPGRTQAVGTKGGKIDTYMPHIELTGNIAYDQGDDERLSNAIPRSRPSRSPSRGRACTYCSPEASQAVAGLSHWPQW